MIIAGLDISINYPAVVKFTLDKKFNVIKTDYIGFTTTKKHEALNINWYHKKNQFKNYYDKNEHISNKIIDFISDCSIVSLEDYAFNAKGQTFHIGEFTGNIKRKIYLKNIDLELYAPTTIKKYATGNGKSNKLDLYNHYNKVDKNYKVDVTDMPVVKNKKGVAPTSDLIDAFWACDMLRKSLSEINK